MSAVALAVDTPSAAETLIQHCREHRHPRAVPAGDITQPSTLQTVLTTLLSQHLARTAPQGTPERYIEVLAGTRRVAAQPAPPWTPEQADETARALATLIGHLEDRGRP